MPRYGWIVALERAPLADTGTSAVFTVNLVRPWSNEEKPDEPRGPAIDDATKKTGDLWFPWSWTNLDWVVFGRFKDADGARAWKEIPKAKVQQPPASQAFENEEAITRALEAEVLEATEQTQYPLSQALEDHQSNKFRSHVHTLAPLTHWPARLSGGALRLTWLLSDERSAFDYCDAVVCFPKFKLKIKQGMVVTDVQSPTAGTLKPGRGFNGKESFSIDYADDAVGFLALSAPPDLAPSADPEVLAGKLPDDGLVLSQGAVSRSALQAAFTNNLLPISVLAAWMDTKVAPVAAGVDAVQKSLVRALWAALGFGREYAGDCGLRPNVAEFLVAKVADARVLRNVIEKDVAQITDAAALAVFASVAKALAEAKTSKDWTQERRSVWVDVQKAVEAMQDTTAKTAAEFRAHWLVVGRLLATEDGLREAMGLWLGNVLNPFFIDAGQKAAWQPVKEKLLRVGEFRKDLVMRAQPFNASTQLWDAARAVARKRDNAALVTELRAKALEAVVVALGKPAQLPDGVEVQVKEQIQRFIDELDRASDISRPRPRDRGLKLDFSGWDSSAGPGSDHRIRGYAIGLCAGHVASKGEAWKPDTKRAQWLTDTAILIDHHWATNKGGGTAWMHEAVGATSCDGEKLVSVEYEGVPIATALSVAGLMKYEGDDLDGFKRIDFAWKDDDAARQLPLLGYGLYYAAKATPLNNIGAVVDKDLRKQADGITYVTELKDASEVLKSLDSSLQYLSSEAPGAPYCTKIDDSLYELSDETQAHAWQAGQIAKAVAAAPGDATLSVPTLQKVALLGKPQTVDTPTGKVVLFPDAADKQVFCVTPHGTHWAFIDRWLATDRLLVENNLPGSDKDLGKKAEVIRRFSETFREKVGVRSTRTPAYHPAVSAIGVELVLFGKSVSHEAVPINRVVTNAAGELQVAGDKLTVDVVAAESGAPRLTIDKRKKLASLEIPRGTFACLRFYALVDEAHFEPGSSKQRYAEKLANTSGIAFPNYRAFSPTERWFETLPEWPEPTGLPAAKVTMQITPPSETDEGLLSPNLLVADLQFPQEKKWTEWLKGVIIERHEWHWTGYPVDFPSGKSELPAWVPSLAGVESFREIIDACFTTSFAGTEWRIGFDAKGNAVVHRWTLAAGARPARYVAYLARPILRFKRWLNPNLGNAGPQKVEADIYARGRLVPGRMREGPLERLATPALKHSIPLTASYSQGLQRGANGVMLVFDDAIRRTDDLAGVGGLGDTIEIDLVDTRIEGVAEMGNNPIFHALKPPPESGLSADAAFGLTFDIGPNPKVAQTAMVVRPVNAGGRWVMAMARARRYILPETELATLLHKVAAPFAPPGHLAAIPTRLDGKDLVPLDFVVDVVKPLQRPLELSGAAGGTLTIKVPKVDKPDGTLQYRYLVSWHKARWEDGGDSQWRAQVVCLSRGDENLAWDRVGTVRGYQNEKLPTDKRIEHWYLVAEAAAANAPVRRIRISDYTEPRWLTFIGSFGNASPGIASDYRFAIKDGVLDKLEVAPGKTATLPTLRNRDASMAGDDPTFHLALVFRAVSDAVRLRTEEGTGELVACYFVDSKAKPDFLKRYAGDKPPASLADCYAHIVTLQRISSMSAEDGNGLKKDTLTELLECAFPAQEDPLKPEQRAKESTLRIVPEYLGPVPIGA